MICLGLVPIMALEALALQVEIHQWVELFYSVLKDIIFVVQVTVAIQTILLVLWKTDILLFISSFHFVDLEELTVAIQVGKWGLYSFYF